MTHCIHQQPPCSDCCSCVQRPFIEDEDEYLRGLSHAANLQNEAYCEGFERGRDEERERCAKIAESLYDKTYWDDPSSGIAAKIRDGK